MFENETKTMLLEFAPGQFFTLRKYDFWGNVTVLFDSTRFANEPFEIEDEWEKRTIKKFEIEFSLDSEMYEQYALPNRLPAQIVTLVRGVLVENLDTIVKELGHRVV